MGLFSASGAVVVMGMLWIGSSGWRSVAVLTLVGVFSGATLLGLWIGLEPIVERYRTLEGDYVARLSVWKETLSLIQAHPLFGTGLGTFPDVYPSVQTTHVTRFVNHAHNDYLEVTAELGIIGAGLLFGLILVVLGRGFIAFFRSPRHRESFLLLGSCGSILALLFHSFADFNLYIPANALVFAVILGLAHSATLHIEARGHDGFCESPSSSRRDLTWGP